MSVHHQVMLVTKPTYQQWINIACFVGLWVSAHKARVLELNSDKELTSIPGVWTMSKILVTTTGSINCN